MTGPPVIMLGPDRQPICPGCGGPISWRYQPEGVCQNCFGTDDDPWRGAR